MKQLAVVGLAALLAFNVNAVEEKAAAGTTGTIGGIATGTIVAGVVAAGVLAAVVSNNRSDSLPVVPPPPPAATCRAGDAAPVNNVCTGTTSTVTVTGTGTRTTTTTVPVTFTYPAIAG